MTLRDVFVQIGFLMVTAGAMLATWGIVTGQFKRGSSEPIEPEAEPREPESEEEPVGRPRAPSRVARERPARPKPAAKKPTAKKPGPRKPAPRKLQPPS
jgi:hypothetical protein